VSSGIHIGTIPVIGTLLGKFGHFSDSSEMVDSRGVLDSSPGRSFLTPKITCFDRFGQEAQKRETGSIESGEISGGGSGGSRAGP